MSSNKRDLCLGSESLEQISVDLLPTTQVAVTLHPSSLMETLEQTEDGMSYQVIQVDSVKGDPSTSVDSLSPILQSTSEYTDQKATLQMNESLNGEFYVLHPGSELFTTVSNTPMIKRVSNSSRHTNTVRVRDERKRASHNEVERRRRDKINTWITKLEKLIPSDNVTNTQVRNGEVQSLRSKGGILAKACDYILELRATNQSIDKYIKSNEQLVSKLDKLSKQNAELKYENNMLKNMLVENGLIEETLGIKKENDNPS